MLDRVEILVLVPDRISFVAWLYLPLLSTEIEFFAFSSLLTLDPVRRIQHLTWAAYRSLQVANLGLGGDTRFEARRLSRSTTSRSQRDLGGEDACTWGFDINRIIGYFGQSVGRNLLTVQIGDRFHRMAY